jgi:hypothetical protein
MEAEAMSWGGNNSQKTPEVDKGSISDEQISTSQEAVPVPYIAGERKVAARWISNIYNQKTVEVKANSGKKGGTGKKGSSAGTGAYDYYGSMAAAVCCGPVDELVAIIIDTEQVWALGNVTRPVDGEPFSGTIAGKGEFVFYWGTETQTLGADSILKPANNDQAEDHPDYKGIAFIEFHELLFGREKVSAPNIEIVVNRKPAQPLVTSTPSELDDDQANLLCAAAELMTNQRFGLGLPSTLFDAPSFQTVAAALYAQRDLSYGSPLLNTQETMRSFLSNIGLMTDSFLLWDSLGAQINAGNWPHGETIDAGTLPQITAADLTEPPDLEQESWTGMETGWSVTFIDRDSTYKESSEKFDDLSLLEITGEPNRATLQRPYITRRTQAAAYAGEWGKSNALPGLAGKISVRKSRAQNLAVGSLFRLDIDAEPGGAQLLQVCRITEMTIRKTGSADITLKAETNLVPIGFTPVIPGSGDGGGSIAEPAALVYVRPVELPPKLSEADYGIAVLAQRQDNMTIGMNLLYDDATDGDFPTIGNQRTFNVRADLSAAFAAAAKSADEVGYDAATDAPLLDVALSNDIDLLNLADDLGLAVARDNQLLLFLMEIEERIENGDFSDGATGWTFSQGDGVAALDTSAGIGQITITTPASTASSTSLIQSFGQMETGRTYRLKFRIKHSAGETVGNTHIYFGVSGFGGENYTIRILSPDTDWVDYAIEHTATADAEGFVRFYADVPTNGFDVYIDDVSVRDTALPIALDADGFPMLEILSLSAMTVPEAGKRRIEALRGRFGTVRRTFSAGAEAWLVYKDTLRIFAHNDFPTLAAAAARAYFKTEPYNAFLSRDISGDGTVDFMFPASRLFAPKITLTASPANGFVGVAVSVEGSITDQDGDLTFWSLSYRNVGAGVQDEISVAGGPIEATDQHEFKVPVRFVEAGTYEIIVRAKDNTTFTDSFVEASFQTAIAVSGDQDPPAAPTALSTTIGFLMIWLEWANPADADFDYTEIWESADNDLANAVKIAETGAAFFSHNVTTAADHYYWIRAVDTSGNVGPYNAGQNAGKLGTAKVLIDGNDVNQQEIIIAYAAQIANAIITDAKIASLSAAKLIAGQIGAELIEMDGANSILQSSNFLTGQTGWRIKGDGTAEFLNMLIRGQIDSGGDLKSSNYVEGTSGWRIKGDGSAEFYDVNIYGDVPMPQLFVGAFELQTGETYTYLQSVTITVATQPGTTAYYRTDGQVPSGLTAELVPANGEITLTGKNILRVVSFEDLTSRSSLTFSADVRAYIPIAVRGRGETGNTDEIFVRSYYGSSATTVMWGISNSNLSPPDSYTNGGVFADFFDLAGNKDGVVSSLLVNPSASGWFWFYLTQSGSRVGNFFVRQIQTSGDPVAWGSNVYIMAPDSGEGNYVLTQTVDVIDREPPVYTVDDY